MSSFLMVNTKSIVTLQFAIFLVFLFLAILPPAQMLKLKFGSESICVFYMDEKDFPAPPKPTLEAQKGRVDEYNCKIPCQKLFADKKYTCEWRIKGDGDLTKCDIRIKGEKRDFTFYMFGQCPNKRVNADPVNVEEPTMKESTTIAPGQKDFGCDYQ